MATSLIIDGVLQEGDSLSLEVTSPGFAYGFGLFESIKFKRKRPCFFDEHFERLQRAAKEVRIEFDYTLEEMRQQTIRLFESNQADEGVFKIVVSSGWKASQVAVFIRNVGLNAAHDPIRLRVSNVAKASNAFTSRRKTLNYMENWLELKEAQGHGFDECLFANELGSVTECSMSNVFFIKDDVLKTASLDCGLLDGVIRGKLLRIAEEDGMRVEEGAYRIEEIVTADEAFTSSSGKGLVGIAEIQTDRLHSFPIVASPRVRRLAERLAVLEEASLGED
jgi:4-amino-4-deoxychorismate lyase